MQRSYLNMKGVLNTTLIYITTVLTGTNHIALTAAKEGLLIYHFNSSSIRR